MLFRTPAECEAFVREAGIDLLGLKSAEYPDFTPSHSIRVSLEGDRHRSFYLAKQFASLLGKYESCLLWVIEFGIWPSSENRHLYQRLRASYGDARGLKDAPGHWFSGEEAEDLATFVDLALQFGWGIHLLSIPPSVHVFVSHDGWARIMSMNRDPQIAPAVEAWGVRYEIEQGENELPRLQ